MGNIGSMSSLLSGGGIRSTIVNRMKSDLLKSIQKQQEARDAIYNPQIERLNDEVSKWGMVRGGVANAVDYTGKAAENAKQIKSLLFDMKVILESMDRDKSYYSKEFDKKLVEINRIADSEIKSFNLIGETGKTIWKNNDMEVKTNPTGSTYTVTGTYLGADYYLTQDGTDKKWVPENGSQTIKQYDSYPATETTEDNISTITGITRTDTNYDSDTISYQVDGVDYTGTIEKGGLDVMQSWMYGGFNDAAGLAKAKADIEAAMTEADLQTIRLQSEQGMVEAESEYITNRIDETKDELAKVMIAQMRDEYNFQYKVQTQYQAMIINFDAMSAMQAHQATIFTGMIPTNKLLGAIYDQST